MTDFGFSALSQGRDHSGLLKTKLGTLLYQAPEIKREKNYVGSTADIFSAGVILFMLVINHCPFKEASNNDNVYKCFINNKSDMFWKWHERQMAKARGLNVYKKHYLLSEELKDLVTAML